MNQNSTTLGVVGEVNGPSVRVRRTESMSSGLMMITGRMYKVGQVGTFVRIPQGYKDIFGIVEQVGADSVPESLRDKEPLGERWLTVQLIGESIGGVFERGIGEYPTVNDDVHIVTEEILHRIYGAADDGQLTLGHLASAESIKVRLDLDKFVTRHSAVLGSTGSGKSTTVSTILRAIAANEYDGSKPSFPSSRILVLDIHGEYSAALGDLAKVYSVTPKKGEERLLIPFWALDYDDLAELLTGGIPEERSLHFRDKIVELKRKTLASNAFRGVSETSLTVDTPIPFSLHKLWYELIHEELKTFEGPNRDQPALEADGDPEKLLPPRYKPWKAGAQIVLNQNAPGIRRPLENLRSRLLDNMFDFLLHPGQWEPDLEGNVEKDLDSTLEEWVGHDRPITILDLSGVPSLVLLRLLGSLLRIIYDALFWSRREPAGGVQRPILIVMEEAHAYLSKERDGPASRIARRIVKEGRKYGIGALVVSQRPAEVDETILSQCGTFVTLRLTNPTDRSQVKGTVPDNLGGLLDLLPVLRTGEAIITGEAAKLPVRVRMKLPGEGKRPNSEDPQVAQEWRKPRIPEDYKKVVALWRSQSIELFEDDSA